MVKVLLFERKNLFYEHRKKQFLILQNVKCMTILHTVYENKFYKTVWVTFIANENTYI